MKQTVRAKFWCESITNHSGSWTCSFRPVASGSDENKEFWKWTPSGHLERQTLAKMPFVVGGEYYLDIVPAHVEPQAP